LEIQNAFRGNGERQKSIKIHSKHIIIQYKLENKNKAKEAIHHKQQQQ